MRLFTLDREKLLKIYSDRAYLPDKENHVIFLYPFWGECSSPTEGVDTGRFDAYISSGSEFISMVSSHKDADIAVLPFEWKSKKQWGNKYNKFLQLAASFENEAFRSGKKMLVFFNSDSDEPVPLLNTIIFRTSFYRSKRRNNEFAVPGWSIDFLHKYLSGMLKVRGKNAVPVVSYTGYVDFDLDDIRSVLVYKLKLIAGWKPNAGSILRGLAVRILKQDTRVHMEFIRRNGFKGGCDEITRREYFLNMLESDYALVTRGAGNFSYRLYEVMSCGRIPVIIDTDCVFPFDHIIDWKKYCVWVDSAEVDRIADKVSEFHENISSKEFEEMQLSIRRLYEEWISPVGFFKNLWRCIAD